ncbi:hypothetical protein PMAYCL1PPCAC_16417, partial [Pristionchus mayeri]
MLNVLQPVIWSHSSLGIVTAVLYLVFKFLLFPAPEMYPIVEESINLIYVQGIIMPLIFIVRFRQDRKRRKAM